MSNTERSSNYSPQPKKRRGHRRVTSGSAFAGEEPHLPEWERRQDAAREEGAVSRDQWLKEQRPPHHELK